MSEEIALDKRAVTHGYTASACLEGAFPSDVSQSDLRSGILSVLFVRCGNSTCDTLTAHLVSLGPVGELGRLNYHSCEKFTECVEQIALSLSLLDSVAVLGEGSLEAVIHSLRQMVVEGVEELLFRLLRDARVFYQGVRDVISCHAIEQKLVMGFVLVFVLLTLEIRANEVPESIADERVKVLHVDDRDELVFQVGLAVSEHH